jgi:hypothetical protein
VCLALAGWNEGVGPATAALVPFLLALAWIVLALSGLLARAGVAWPERDVFQLVVRWGRSESELPAVSLGASILQFLLSIATIPAVRLLPPSVLYQPELGPSAAALATSVLLSLLLVVPLYAAWSGRIGVEAPREQQREAEEHA